LRRWLPLIALGLSGCALVTLSTKRRSWPDPGEVEVQHLDADVKITLDELGIPHVRATTEADAWYALGAMHARDRLFQADVTRRLAWGRLSEWFGPDLAEMDVFWKGLELRDRAGAAVDALDPATRKAVEAYVAGFNAGVGTLDALPVEYRLLRAEFEPWTIEDCAALVFVNSWGLADNPGTELSALSLRKHDRATLDALLRQDGGSPPVDGYWDDLRQQPIGEFTPEFRGFAEVMVGWGDSGSASNNWVVGPSRSADGKPILANDPHLIQRVPSVWYAADVQGGDVHVAGVTMPGSPFVILGHNDTTAWGFTNVMADVVDLAVIQRGAEPDTYVLGGETKTYRKVPVEVAVKGADPVRREILWTEIGPVITSPDSPAVVALRWHALELTDRSPDLFRSLNRAKTVDEALAAVATDTSIAQNLVVADTSGSYAWQVFGTLVDRKAHTGRVPYPASAAEHGWDGWLEHKPGERDPDRGWVRTANSAPDDPAAYDITAQFIPPWRAGRIDEVLGARSDHSVATMAALQTDRVDTHARARIPALLDGVEPSTREAAACREMLLGWDHVAAPQSTGAAVWYVFQRELITEALADDLAPDELALYLKLASSGRSVIDGDLDRFLPDRKKGVDAALGRTCTWLGETLGASPEGWQWGRLHHLEVEHFFGGQLPGWNLPAVPYGGSENTVDQAAFSWAGGADLDATWIASMRLVVPLSDPSKATLVYPGGQSGHPGHPHSRDQLDAFLSGDTHPLWYSDADVAAHAASELVLVAGDPRGLGTVLQTTGTPTQTQKPQ
jgi:penicillin amidase